MGIQPTAVPQSFSTCVDAKVVQCLISGHAVNPSMGARSRPPVSYGPETRHHTPSASWVMLILWILTDKHGVWLKAGVGGYYQDRTRQEAEYRAIHGCTRASPGSNHPPQRTPRQGGAVNRYLKLA